MGWIEDPEKGVLLVRQAAGLKLWTLPGGKVKRGESLVKALKREIFEETGLRTQIGSLLGALDRHDKDAITLLFAAILNEGSIKLKDRQKEIKKVEFQGTLPKKASPSVKYFWLARKGLASRAPKIPASTHQLPLPEGENSLIAPRRHTQTLDAASESGHGRKRRNRKMAHPETP